MNLSNAITRVRYRIFLLLPCIFFVGCEHDTSFKPQRKDIIDAVFADGHLEKKDLYVVTSNIEGFLNSSYVSVDDTVYKDQRLFLINNSVSQVQEKNTHVNLHYAEQDTAGDSPAIAQLKLQMVQAQEKAVIDSTNYSRYQRLVKTRAVSSTDFDNVKLQFDNSTSNLKILQKNLLQLQQKLSLNLENARSQYKIQSQNSKYYDISSRQAGIVLSINKKVGDYVKIGDEIAEIGAGITVIKLNITEDDIEKIKVGQEALVSLNTNKDKIFKAHITKIYPSFNTNQQSFIAEAMFKNMPVRPINNTQLQCNIIIQKKKNALVIPAYLLGNGDFVHNLNSKKRYLLKLV